MSEDNLRTSELHQLTQRARQGDREAQSLLLRRVADRLERMARSMLRGYPGLRRHADTDDVLQGAVMRLLRALETIDPASTREFYGLAAEQMRRELLDLTKHFNRRGLLRAPEVTAEAITEEGDLQRWRDFHEAIERLGAAEREVFCLSYYHGWTQAAIAELMQVTERQVRRRYNAALLALSAALGGELPGSVGEEGVTG